MTIQNNNTEVKAETGFAKVINDDELKQASGGAFFLLGPLFAAGFFNAVANSELR